MHVHERDWIKEKLILKKGFTLAEVMITLTVIGIITAVIIPVAINSKPDENIMKFKKAHNTLYQVISELVNSNKYCSNGDLGVLPNGDLVDSPTYLCETFADIVSAKTVNCSNKSTSGESVILNSTSAWVSEGGENGVAVTQEAIIAAKNKADSICKNTMSTIGEEIVLNDGTIFFDAKPIMPFGKLLLTSCGLSVNPKKRAFGDPPCMYDNNGFNIAYKVFCFDIDGINKGEDPFGYGIRADGKILTGARADEWLEKSIQGEN